MANIKDKLSSLELASQMGMEIKRISGAQQVLLFGSHAWGMPTSGSDLDFFVIADITDNPRLVAARIRQSLDKAFGVIRPIDIIVRTPEQVKARISADDYFIKKIIQTGIPL